MYFAQTFTLLFSNLTAVESGTPKTVHSQLVCATLCLERGDCSSFFYNADTKGCIASSVRHFTTTNLTETEGYMYFIMRHDCNDEWIVRRGHCYQFINVSKSAAKAACEQRGGYPANINTAVIVSGSSTNQSSFYSSWSLSFSGTVSGSGSFSMSGTWRTWSTSSNAGNDPNDEPDNTDKPFLCEK